MYFTTLLTQCFVFEEALVTKDSSPSTVEQVHSADFALSPLKSVLSLSVYTSRLEGIVSEVDLLSHNFLR